MKRRILSILLLCSMVLTTLPATAFAEEEQDAPIAETPVCSCETACTEEGMNADCPVCGAEGAALEACQKYVPAAEAAEEAEAEPEPEQQPEEEPEQPEEQPEKEPEPTVQEPAPAVQNAEGAGTPVTYAAVKEVSTEDELKAALGDSSISTIKLMENVDITSTLTINRTVTLDLNGKVLKMTVNGRVIEVSSGSTLTLEDSNPSTEHKFREDATGLWVLDESGDKTVQGGVITGGKADRGGGVYVEGRFNMNGGNIVGCHANNDGGVYVGGTFQMGGNAKIIGCSFNENNPAGSAGVYVGGTMTMTGGEISNCKVGLYIAGTLNANGGKVKSYVASTGTITSGKDLSNTTVFEGNVTSSDGGHISHGEFRNEVNNITGATITGGVFYGSVKNYTYDERIPTIEGGTFKGSVTNEPGCTINKGTFKNPVTNEDGGVISGGTFEKGITGTPPSIAYCTVTFDPNDGTGEPETLYYLSGSKVAKPADPTRAGYAFTDWYNGDEKYDFDQLVTTDLILTAHWRKTIPGKGTEAEPYQISSAEDLKVFRDIVNGTDGQAKNTGAWGVLTDNIDLSGEEWTPIGKVPESAENQDLPYKGTFNGNGHTIKGLKITSGEYAGLFGYIRGATIADVTLKGGSIKTEGKYTYAGGIVAYAQGGTITGCGNENPVTGGSATCVGGIAGAVNGNVQIDRSYNTGAIAGTSDNNLISCVGGLIGRSFAGSPKVIDCYNTGAVRTGKYVGGLSGSTEGSDCSFYSCYNTGSVTDGTQVGDITGDKAHCSSCYHLKTSNNNYGNGQSEEAESKTAEEFANGTVLKLLKENNVDKRTGDDPWDDECKYLPAAKSILPVLAWQNLTKEHEHSWSDWSHVDGTETHTRSCTVCFEQETKDCHGGTATCTAKAKCEECQAEYGEMAAHQFTAENVAESYLASAATCTEPAVYYTSCAACGAKGTEIFTYGDPLDHDWGDWTSNGDGTHTRTCKRDATHTETGDCTGGTATCMAKAECEICGGAYGETDPDNHADGCYPEWTISKTEHQEKYTLCGQVLVAQAEHTFGDWNVTKKATTKRKGEKERTCEVCEYRQFETIPVKSSGKSGKDSDKSTETTKNAKNGSPKTGDSSNVPLWTALLCVSACGVTGTVLTRKRKRTK